MKRLIHKALFTIVFLFLSLSAIEKVNAQELEFGGWAGFSNYFGDLNTNASFEYIGPAGGFFFRYNLGTRFAFKTGINYGRIAFEDRSSPFVYQQMRNLSFKTNIYELSGQIEFNFFKYDKEKKQFNFTPYLLLGVSAFYFNPVAEFEGQNYQLQPIQTEGKKYSRVSFGIPVGGGFKYSFNPFWAIGIEGGYRWTITDYLDDVSSTYIASVPVDGTTPFENLSDRSGEVTDPSIGKPGKQRGFSEDKDSYLFIGISISYTIIKVKCPKPSKIP